MSHSRQIKPYGTERDERVTGQAEYVPRDCGYEQKAKSNSSTDDRETAAAATTTEDSDGNMHGT